LAVSTTIRISGASDVSTPLSRGVEQLRHALVGAPEIARGQVDAPGELVELVDDGVAMAKIRGRRARDAVDLGFHRSKALLDARDDAGDLPGAFAGGLRALGCIAAFADQAFDLAVEIAHGVGDLVCGLPGGLREVLDLACDHGEAASGIAGTRGLDRRVQRQQIGLLGDRLDRPGDFCDLRQRRADGA
jgi:hypothetical protein